MPLDEVAVAAVGALAVLLLMRFLAWRIVLAMAAATRRWPLVGESRAWARVRPLQAWLRQRWPRVSSFLSARLDTGGFTGLPMTLLVLAALYLGALLEGLTEHVIEAGAVLRFDQAINAALDAWRRPLLVAMFLWVTALGGGPALSAVSVTATAFLWAHRRASYILPLWVTFLGAQATTWPGKYLINRHRPSFLPDVIEASPSFPSGHATASMALFGFLAYALARDLPDARQRFEIGFWAAVLILAIAFSRVFLSVHYTTDVLAGLLVGLFWLLAGLGLREWLLPRR